MSNLPDVRNEEPHKGKKRWQHFENRMDELRAQGLLCDPIQVLMEVASGTYLDKQTGQLVEIVPRPEPKDRAKAAAELCSYLYPKLKSVEVSGADGQPIQFIVTPDLTPLPVVSQSNQLTGGDMNRQPPTIEGEIVGEDESADEE